MTGSGLSLGLGLRPGGGPAYIPEATALFARMTTQPDATRKGLINDVIGDLIDAGLWADHQAFWVQAAHNAQAGRLDWLGNHNLSAIGSPTFTTDKGYAGNGATSYLSTGLNPSESEVASQNDTSMWVWLNDGDTAAGSSTAVMGAVSTNSLLIIPRNASDTLAGRINATSSVGFTGATATTRLGFSALSRTAVGASEGRHDALAGTDGHASTGLVGAELYIGAYNNGGIPASLVNNGIAAAGFAAGLSSAKLDDLYDIIGGYLTAIGAI